MKKDYDDRLLTELLSCGELTHTEIAEQVGISHQLVSDIAGGKRRPELLPAIAAGLRASLADARRDILKMSQGDPVRAPRRQAGARREFYDDDLLVELIACAELSYRQIAERVGVHHKTVQRVARGASRLDLQDRIRAEVASRRRAAARVVGRRLRDLVTRHIEEGMGARTEHARRCREFLIDLCYDDEP